MIFGHKRKYTGWFRIEPLDVNDLRILADLVMSREPDASIFEINNKGIEDWHKSIQGDVAPFEARSWRDAMFRVEAMIHRRVGAKVSLGNITIRVDIATEGERA
jgi:hypothetical protein